MFKTPLSSVYPHISPLVSGAMSASEICSSHFPSNLQLITSHLFMQHDETVCLICPRATFWFSSQQHYILSSTLKVKEKGRRSIALNIRAPVQKYTHLILLDSNLWYGKSSHSQVPLSSLGPDDNMPSSGLRGSAALSDFPVVFHLYHAWTHLYIAFHLCTALKFPGLNMQVRILPVSWKISFHGI